MKIRAYFHADKLYLYEKATDAGLSEEASRFFSFAGEIGVEFDVNEQTGQVVSAEIFSPKPKTESES